MALKRRFLLLTAVCSIAYGVVPAYAEYPDKPITIIYPWPAGDPTSAIMRTIGELASKKLGQPVVINNIKGAGGTKALAAGVKAKADGYTLTSNWVAAQVGAKLFNPKLPYNNDGMVPIAGVFALPFTVTVKADHPAKDIKDFVARAKSQGKKLNVGVCAPQSVPRLVGERFMQAANLPYNPIPFGGGCGGDNMTGLLNGSLDVSIGVVPLARVFKGQIKHLGLITDKRHVSAPDLPTATEQGIKIGWVDAALGWGGLIVPKGTPADATSKLRKVFGDVLQSDELRESLGARSAIISYRSPEDFRTLWADAAKALKPQVEAILKSK